MMVVQARSGGTRRRELQDGSAGDAQFAIGGEASDAQLLLRLADVHGLELAVTREHYRLIYRLEQEPDDSSGKRCFRLAMPMVVEGFGVSRQARLAPPLGEVGVIDGSGLLRQPQAVDISGSGLCLRVRATAAPAIGLALEPLWLQLPCGRLLQVAPRIVRVQPDATPGFFLLGLHFGRLDSAVEAALARYIFERHPAFRDFL